MFPNFLIEGDINLKLLTNLYICLSVLTLILNIIQTLIYWVYISQQVTFHFFCRTLHLFSLRCKHCSVVVEKVMQLDSNTQMITLSLLSPIFSYQSRQQTFPLRHSFPAEISCFKNCLVDSFPSILIICWSRSDMSDATLHNEPVVLSAYYYGKKKSKRVGRPPGGHSNLEGGVKRRGRRRKRRKQLFVHKKRRSSASVDNTPAGSPQVTHILSSLSVILSDALLNQHC